LIGKREELTKRQADCLGYLDYEEKKFKSMKILIEMKDGRHCELGINCPLIGTKHPA